MVQPYSRSLKQYFPCTGYLFTPPSRRNNLSGKLNRIFKTFFAASLVWSLFFVIKCALILDCVITVLSYFVDQGEDRSIASSRRPSLSSDQSSKRNRLRFSRTSSCASFPEGGLLPLRRSSPNYTPARSDIEPLDTEQISPFVGENPRGNLSGREPEDMYDTAMPDLVLNEDVALLPLDPEMGEGGLPPPLPASSVKSSTKSQSSSSSARESSPFKSDSSFPVSAPLSTPSDGRGYLRRASERLAPAEDDDSISDNYDLVEQQEGQNGSTGLSYVVNRVYDFFIKS